jgi:hypothetical protein
MLCKKIDLLIEKKLKLNVGSFFFNNGCVNFNAFYFNNQSSNILQYYNTVYYCQ